MTVEFSASKARSLAVALTLALAVVAGIAAPACTSKPAIPVHADSNAPVSIVIFVDAAKDREMRVFFFDGDTPSTFERATRADLWRGEAYMKSHVSSRTPERVVFSIDDGLFAGGEFIVGPGPGFGEVELVRFGSGVHVVSRERGSMSTPL